MRQFNAIAACVANSTALRFKTGNAPGNPRHTGQTWVFGAAPNCVEHEQKILVVVRSWTWTSRPMTGSYFVWADCDVAGSVAISADYKARSAKLGRVETGLAPSVSGGVPVIFQDVVPLIEGFATRLSR